MAAFVYKPLATRPGLSNLIQQYWVGEVTTAAGQSFTHLAPAHSSAQILLHYQGAFATEDEHKNASKNLVAGFYGPNLLPKQYTTGSRQAAIFGIQLTPWAIPALFSIPASQVTNQTIALADLLGASSNELVEKLLSAATPEAKAHFASAFFEQRLRRQQHTKFGGLAYAIGQIHRTQGQLGKKALVDASCLSNRQFERNFKALTGFSAQTYSRIIRFENAIRRLAGLQGSLTDFALAGGYYDQAHFNHDFKRFTGLTPREYWAFESFSSR
jgi:AraC-like DNA-binding protein